MGERMTAQFKVLMGELPHHKKWRSKRIDRSRLAEFWNQIGNGHRKGVYVFGTKAAKGWKPLYAGMTIDQTFESRIYQHVNGGTFDRYLKGTKKGTPYLFLLARVGKGRSSTTAIDTLEAEVINYCFGKNNKLHNRRRIEKPIYIVQGFGQGGGKAASVKALKKNIGWH